MRHKYHLRERQFDDIGSDPATPPEDRDDTVTTTHVLLKQDHHMRGRFCTINEMGFIKMYESAGQRAEDIQGVYFLPQYQVYAESKEEKKQRKKEAKKKQKEEKKQKKEEKKKQKDAKKKQKEDPAQSTGNSEVQDAPEQPEEKEEPSALAFDSDDGGGSNLVKLIPSRDSWQRVLSEMVFRAANEQALRQREEELRDLQNKHAGRAKRLLQQSAKSTFDVLIGYLGADVTDDPGKDKVSAKRKKPKKNEDPAKQQKLKVIGEPATLEISDQGVLICIGWPVAFPVLAKPIEDVLITPCPDEDTGIKKNKHRAFRLLTRTKTTSNGKVETHITKSILLAQSEKEMELIVVTMHESVCRKQRQQKAPKAATAHVQTFQCLDSKSSGDVYPDPWQYASLDSLLDDLEQIVKGESSPGAPQ